MIRRTRATRVALLLLLVSAIAAAPALGQTPRAGVVTAVKGRSTASRPGLAQPIALKSMDPVFVRDRIDTREDALVRLLLAGKAVVTLRELSSFTITEEPGRAIVDLKAGTASLGVAPHLLAPGESIEIRTPNAIAAVRGSALVVEVSLADGVPQTLISSLLVSKDVTISLLANPGLVHLLASNQFIQITGLGPATTSSPVGVLTPGRLLELKKLGEVPRSHEGIGVPEALLGALVNEANQVANTLGANGTFGGPALNTRGVGVNENVCLAAASACTGPPGPPPGLPPGPPTFVTPAGTALTNSGGQGGSGPLFTPPGQLPPPPPPGGGPSGTAFTPPGQGGAKPNAPGNPNPNPGHGGVPPGQLKK
jgi:hypothetical protein